MEGEIIVAPATVSGGALGMIRISGEGSISLCDKHFRGRKRLADAASHTLHFGGFYADDELIDEVVASLFHAPHSYTGEETVELSCHGSRYIQQRILRTLIESGARMATAGEFSIRAYLNGRLDLSQAEAVADLIAAESQAAHTLALRQMRGGYSHTLDHLHNRLIQLCALLELELDFAEEDVEFAQRSELADTMHAIEAELKRLEESFRLGNVLRDGVPVAIVGRPNVGKSTLLNALVGDDRALVSEIAGTTRDTIEESIQIGGVLFRFVDTAGLHETSDRLEQLGIERTHTAIDRARVVIHVVDPTDQNTIEPLHLRDDQQCLQVVNKCDLIDPNCAVTNWVEVGGRETESTIRISAKRGEGIELLREALRQTVDTSGLERGETIVSNERHAEALHEARKAIQQAHMALTEELPSDLLAEELRQVAHHIGSITGTITSDDILHSIFANFCIGK